MYHPNRLTFTKNKVRECVLYLTGQGPKLSWWFDNCKIKEDKLYYENKQIVPEEEVDKVLQQVYNDPKLTGGRDRVYDYVEERYVGISRRTIMEFLKNQESYQLRAPVKKPKITSPIFSAELNGHWQMDLVDMSRYTDQGYKWIFVVVDVFSRYVWARALKTKEGVSVRNALSDVFQERRPIILQSDNGKEFKNSEVKTLLNLFHITQVFSKSYTPTTQGLVERFNGSLKNKIFNGFLRNGNKRWVQDLPAYVENLNSSVQSTIQEKPDKVQENKQEINDKVEDRLIERNIQQTKRAPKFNYGDHVRIATSALHQARKNKFHKGLLKWTREIYRIDKVIRVNPDQPWDNERYIVNRSLYNGYQLQKVNVATLQRMPVVEKRIPSTSPPLERRNPSTRNKRKPERFTF